MIKFTPGDRVEHVETAPYGTVKWINEAELTVCVTWDDGRDELFYWDGPGLHELVPYLIKNARCLQKLRRKPITV
jgi:hypothetical protein